MKNPVSRDAAATLAAVNAALRRAEDLHWSDPEFLAWEAGQTGPLARYNVATVDGEDIQLCSASAGPACGHYVRETVYSQPMIRLMNDDCAPDCPPGCLGDDAYRMHAADRAPDTYSPLPMRDEPDPLTQHWMNALHAEIKAMGRSYDAQDEETSIEHLRDVAEEIEAFRPDAGAAEVTIRVDIERYRPVAEEVAW